MFKLLILQHYACRAGHKDVVESLLSHGADVNKPIRSSQATGLHRAAAMGHLDIAKLLISKGSKVCAADADNQTALHKVDDIPGVGLLRLRSGVNFSVTENFDLAKV